MQNAGSLYASVMIYIKLKQSSDLHY